MSLIQHSGAIMAFQPRIRRGAFLEAAWRHGCRKFSVYNRTYISTNFADPVDEYWKVIRDVAIWPVMGERQVEISGPDAQAFVDYLTPRNMQNCAVGQCKYALITAPDGGIVSDPIILRVDQDRFWLSTSDCDLELWARGVAVGSRFDVATRDAEVSVIQVQGPKSPRLMAALFGDAVLDLRYYWVMSADFMGHPLQISRTGWSGEFGYEIYLENASQGDALFEALMEAGRPSGVAPGAVNHIRRIESGILSWGVDMTLNENPFEIGLGRLVELDGSTADFVGRAALEALRDQPLQKKLVGLELDGAALAHNETPWPLFDGAHTVGKLTSLAYSPRLEKNIAIGLVHPDYAETGARMSVETWQGVRRATVIPMPFVPKSQNGSARALLSDAAV